MTARKHCTVGCSPVCTTCKQLKVPVGRSPPCEWGGCNHECPGYREDPSPCDLWPGEEREPKQQQAEGE